MIEIVMIIALVVFATRAASVQNESSLIWGAVAGGLCVASLFVLPGLPFLRVFIATGVLIVAWTVVAIVRK